MDLFKFFRRKEAPSEPPVEARRTLKNIMAFMPRWLRGDYTLKNSELIFSAVSRISNTLSAMPVQLYRGATPIKSDLNDLVNFEPNPNMTACQFFKTLEACRCSEGNAYALKWFNPQGQLEQIRPLDPTRVKPILEKKSQELWFETRPEEGDPYYLHNYYILHIPFISTNGYTGVNPVSVLSNTLSYTNDIQTFSTDQLRRGVNAQIVLEAPANLGQQQKEDMLADFVETYQNTAGNILLLESGVQAKTLNLSPVDSMVFEVEKISRSRVAMVYNIPPSLLGDFSSGGFSSQEELMLQFLTLTMLPIVTAYEQELNRKLLTKEERKRGYHFKFNMSEIVRADAATMADVHQKSIRGGWETPNEARLAYGRERNADGDHLLVSRDLTTLKYIIENPDNKGGQNNVPE